MCVGVIGAPGVSVAGVGGDVSAVSEQKKGWIPGNPNILGKLRRFAAIELSHSALLIGNMLYKGATQYGDMNTLLPFSRNSIAALSNSSFTLLQCPHLHIILNLPPI